MLTRVAIASIPSNGGVPGPDGLHVDVDRDKYKWKVIASQARNACASLRGRALDEYGELGMFVRFADELFRFVINGVQVGTALEATFGFGEIAWYAGSNDAPAKLVLESLTVRRVL